MRTATNRIQVGIATLDVTVSSHVGSNDGIFPSILSLQVPEESAVKDITFGREVFWQSVDETKYRLAHLV